MRAAVVGGGITGLAAAWALHRAGSEVVLLEREGRLGGKIRTVRRDGFLFEAGPDGFLATKPAALDLCRALGLERELVRARPGRAYVWARGSLHPLPAGTRLVPSRLGPLLASGLLTPRERIRAALDLVLPGAAPDEDESLASLVGRRMGRAVVDRIAAPLLAGIHAADPERLSVAATFPVLLEAERDHGSLLRGLHARGEGRAGGTPFVTLAGGLGTLVDRLTDALSEADIRVGAGVERLERTGGGWRLTLASGDTIDADRVVLAVPTWAAAPLLAPHAPWAAALLSAVEWVSTAVITLGYAEPDAPPLSGHGFVVARDQPARITGCTWTSSKWPARTPEGRVLVRAYLGRVGDPVDLDAADEALVALARADLARAIGLAAEPVLADVARWPVAMPQFAVGHLTRVAAVERELDRLGGVRLAGAGYRGTGIPDCVAQGLRAVRILGRGSKEDDVLQPEAESGF